MTYEKIVAKVKKAYEAADASKVEGHVAIEFDIWGEGEGAFYLEIADGKASVEPYEYYDRDAKLFCDAEKVNMLVDGKLTYAAAVADNAIGCVGNAEKVALLDLVVLKKAARKTAAKKAAKKVEAEVEKKAEPVKKAAKKAVKKVEAKAEEVKAEVEKKAEPVKKAVKSTAKKAAKKAEPVVKAVEAKAEEVKAEVEKKVTAKKTTRKTTKK